jgi:hypothetical protein
MRHLAFGLVCFAFGEGVFWLRAVNCARRV